MDECLHAVGWCHCVPASAPQGEPEPNYRDEDGTYPTYFVPLFAPQGEGNTDRCPTCESDDPSVCTTGYAHTHNPSMCCPDPWHSDLGADPITNPEGD